MVLNHSLFPLSDVGSSQELVMSLLAEGERALLEGDRKGIEVFEEAEKLDPASPSLFFRQGLALLEFGSRQNNLNILRKATQKFKQATALNGDYCEAWHAWANTLLMISKLSGNKEDLIEAQHKIEKALAKATQELASELHWDAGLIAQELAHLSGEVDDLVKAISHFEKSSGTGETLPQEFWTDFGKAYAHLSEKLHDIRPVVKAIYCYKQSISHTLANWEGWIGLGRSLKKLYHYTRETDHFRQAYDCFVAASELRPKNRGLWLERIDFLIEAARRKKDPAKLKLALDKCQQASHLMAPADGDYRTSLDPEKWDQLPIEKPSVEYTHLLGLWAEALALMGEWNEKIELIHEAEQKMQQALELSEEDDPALILLHGKALYSFGKYYHDVDLFYQAIEQFQASLSIDRTQVQGWAWMGYTYATVFDITDEIDAHEKALRFYQKALQLSADPFIYFEIAALLVQKGEINRQVEPLEQAISYLDYLFQTYKTTSYEHPEWFFQYGIALSHLGDLNDDASLQHKALEAFVNVLMLAPHFKEVHHKIGVAYSHLGDALGEVDYLYRALHHFKIAQKSSDDEESLHIDWGITFMNLAEFATDSTMEHECLRLAEQKLLYAAELGNLNVYYQLACLYSLQGFFERSLCYLLKGYIAKTLPPLEEILDDAWLEGVRLSPEFQEFLALLQKN